MTKAPRDAATDESKSMFMIRLAARRVSFVYNIISENNKRQRGASFFSQTVNNIGAVEFDFGSLLADRKPGYWVIFCGRDLKDKIS